MRDRGQMGLKTSDKTGLAISSRLALSTALASIVFGGYGGRKVYAACTTGIPGTYTCSGTLSTKQVLPTAGTYQLTVTTSPSFSITTTSAIPNNDAFNLTGTGGLTFTDNNYSSITGNREAIEAYNSAGGALTITTTGFVEGGGYGIYAANNFGTDMMVSSAVVTGGAYGIHARNYNTSGELSITATGTVTGTGFGGIHATNSGKDLTIITEAVSGAWYGIVARNKGSGVLSVTSNGIVTGGNGYDGIHARNYYATSTDLTINTAAVTGGRHGIDATNDGTGKFIHYLDRRG